VADRNLWLRILINSAFLWVYRLAFHWLLADDHWAQRVGVWACDFFLGCYAAMAVLFGTASMVSRWRSNRG
jgi:hypothetical protein